MRGFNRQSSVVNHGKKSAAVTALRAAIEPLESRRLLTAVVVNTTLDGVFPPSTGLVSLRNAILTANGGSTPTTITFDPTVFVGEKTITQNGSVLTVGNNLQPITITAPAAGVILNANNQNGGFQINQGVTAISGITITKSTSPGINNDGSANSSNLTLSRVTVSNCSSGITSGNGTLAMAHCSVLNNSGAGITGSGMTISDTVVSGNSNGGIVLSGTDTLTNTTITGNSAPQAAGVKINGNTTAVLTSCTVSDNTATQNGGGIFNYGTLTLIDSTISGNTAALGGGIYNSRYGQGITTLTNVTISGNRASTDGGGIYNLGTATVANSIIANNAGPGSDAVGSFNSLGYNIIGKTDGSIGWNGGDLTGSIAKPLSPKLGTLADNGGPTQTMLPLAGSPAIDAGLNAFIPAGIKTDQRGLPRIVNGTVDIGAVEVQAASTSSITLTAPAAQSAIAGQRKLFLLGSFAGNNVTGPFSVDVNWGDGSADTKFPAAAIGTIAAQVHTYASAVSKTVSETVSDGKGHVSNKATFSITVAAPPPVGNITGNVFSDANANGKLDTGEKGLPGVTVFIDANKNGVLDATETKVTTDSSGNFKFTNLPAGTYRVREVLPPSYALTAPALGYFDVPVVSGGTASGLLFADALATASITGRVFNDGNGNGLRDVGEAGLGLWKVYIDLNNNGVLDGKDPSVVTDINGNWSFTGLVAGTYTVRVVPVAGLVATKPTGGVLKIVLTAGKASGGNLFGEKTIS